MAASNLNTTPAEISLQYIIQRLLELARLEQQDELARLEQKDTTLRQQWKSQFAKWQRLDETLKALVNNTTLDQNERDDQINQIAPRQREKWTELEKLNKEIEKLKEKITETITKIRDIQEALNNEENLARTAALWLSPDTNNFSTGNHPFSP